MYRFVAHRWLIAHGFLVLAMVCGGEARAAVLTNGSFETPALASGAFVNFSAGSEPSGFGWSVGTGNVDLGNLPITPFVQYSAYDGNQVVDLNGNSRGSLYQDFATVVGQMYKLTFAYADNPVEGGVSSADVDVWDLVSSASLLHAGISHSTSTNTATGADYLLYSGSFTATGLTTRLSFRSTSASDSASGGIILDAVDVSPMDPGTGGQVPEPASLAVWLSLATVGVVLAKKKFGTTIV